MKTYKVYAHYDGCIAYEIEAEDEDDALEQADLLFGEEPAESLADNFCDCGFDIEEIN